LDSFSWHDISSLAVRQQDYSEQFWQLEVPRKSAVASAVGKGLGSRGCPVVGTLEWRWIDDIPLVLK